MNLEMHRPPPPPFLVPGSGFELQATWGERGQVVPPGDLVHLAAEASPRAVYPVASPGGYRASGGRGSLLFTRFSQMIYRPCQYNPLSW